VISKSGATEETRNRMLKARAFVPYTGTGIELIMLETMGFDFPGRRCNFR
jgi:hypothetical protein